MEGRNELDQEADREVREEDCSPRGRGGAHCLYWHQPCILGTSSSQTKSSLVWMGRPPHPPILEIISHIFPFLKWRASLSLFIKTKQIPSHTLDTAQGKWQNNKACENQGRLRRKLVKFGFLSQMWVPLQARQTSSFDISYKTGVHWACHCSVHPSDHSPQCRSNATAGQM